MDYRLHKNNPLMHQHVITCGRHELIRQWNEEPSPIWTGRAVISINDTDSEVHQFEVDKQFLGARDVLILKFADDDFSMLPAHAEQIAEFVERNIHCSFLVHCFIGSSRSVAVAKWLNERMYMGDIELATVKHYNQHVYSTLVRYDEQFQPNCDNCTE